MPRKRSGRHGLRGGAPRLLGVHDGVHGRWYRECWAALSAEYGQFAGLGRLEAGRVCLAWCQLRATTTALVDGQRARQKRAGKPPSVRQLERLAKRAGLADSTYSQALDKLRALMGGASSSVAAALRRVRA